MNDLLAEMQKEWKQDSPLDKSKLDDEALNVPKLHSKYTNYLNVAKRLLRKKTLELEKLEHVKKEWYGGYLTKDEMDMRGFDYNPLKGRAKPMKSEMGNFVKVDNDVLKLRDEVEEMRDVRDFLIDVVEAIKWRHQHIRNAIDWQRFMAGG